MQTDREALIKLAQRDTTELSPEELSLTDKLSKVQIPRPLVMVNSSTSGIVAGSMSTWKAIEEYTAERSIEIDLAETGSIGLSSEDPVISIQLPGRTRIFFSRITAERVPSLLDDIFHQVVPDQNVIGQLYRKGQEPWKDVPSLEDIPLEDNLVGLVPLHLPDDITQSLDPPQPCGRMQVMPADQEVGVSFGGGRFRLLAQA